MPSQSTMLPLRGQFRQLYMALKHARLLDTTPIVFCEGDSWFSTPLAMNLLDWLVSPAPEDEEKGIPLFGKGGLFFRVERSGDHASPGFTDPGRVMFSRRNIDDLLGWYRKFDFDLILLSAGGNDFVDGFLRKTFRGLSQLSPQSAYQVVLDSGRYQQVRSAYEAFLTRFIAARPRVPVLAHTYVYPRLLGVEGPLTVYNAGLAAVLKKSVGPWIGPYIENVLAPGQGRNRQQMIEFAHLLIDGFEEHVLRTLKADPRFSANFDYVDLRNLLPNDSDWFDEMHPTEAGFHVLASQMRGALIARLPAAKR